MQAERQKNICSQKLRAVSDQARKEKQREIERQIERGREIRYIDTQKGREEN